MSILHVIFIYRSYQGVVETWTCQRQDRYGFSSTACDQAIEHTFNTNTSNTKGGIVGLTLNRAAVKRWMRDLINNI